MSLTSGNTTDSRHRRRSRSGRSNDRSAFSGQGGYFRWKIVVDVLIAVLLALPVGVVVAVLVLLVRATSKGPGIYRQVRVGKDGRRYMMYKIRTMRIDAEAASGPVWTQIHDPRVTFVGGILRKLHLDELPQILNVLRGDMSLVGPRPERPEFVRILAEAVPRYRDRLAVRPGITGLAQINLPPDSDLTSVRRKLVLDLDYIQHGNLWLDCRLLLCTGLRIFKISEGFAIWLLGLARPGLLAAIDASAECGLPPETATPATILLQAAQASSASARADGAGVGLNDGTSRKPR